MYYLLAYIGLVAIAWRVCVALVRSGDRKPLYFEATYGPYEYHRDWPCQCEMCQDVWREEVIS
jgi:hypothetical protein